MKKIYDVIVIGAGPAGSSSAYFLAKQGLQVLLLDKAVFPRDKTCGDALSSRALDVIDKMGATTEVINNGKKISKVQFVSPDKREVVASLTKKGNRKGVVVIPRIILDEILKNRTLAEDVDFIENFNVKNVIIDNDGATIQGAIQNKKFDYRSQIVVVATGANISFLKRIGVLKKSPQTMFASRCYFSNVPDLENIIFRYDELVLPSYSWIFPLPNNRVNVGAGFNRVGKNANKMPKTSNEALKKFLGTPVMRQFLQGAVQDSKIKSYPLRVDFLSSPNISKRIVLVGEAAGLVNPLTGEGIDYALETGYIVSKALKAVFEQGDFSLEGLNNYDLELKKSYGKEFYYLEKVRNSLFSNVRILNKLMKEASQNETIKDNMLKVALGIEKPNKLLSPFFLLKLLGFPGK